MTDHRRAAEWCTVCKEPQIQAEVNDFMNQGFGARKIKAFMGDRASKNGIRNHITHTLSSAVQGRGSFLATKPMGSVIPGTSSGSKTGYSVSIDEVSGTGEGTTHARPRGTLVTQEDVIRDFGLDPGEWQVTSLKRSFWEQSKGLDDGTRDVIELESIRATFKAVPKNSKGKVKADVKLVQEAISKWEIPSFKSGYSGTGLDSQPLTFTSLIADWQLGKGEGGGTEETVSNIMRSFEAAYQRVNELMLAGRNIEKIAFLGLGDIVEQCQGHYAMQTYLTDRNMREQRRLAWQLGMKATYLFADLGIPIYWSGVSGNHDESRKDGKAFTDFSDSDALLMLDVMKELTEADPRLNHVTVELPEDPMVQLVSLSGVNVGMVHGHQFRGGANSSAKAEKWWTGQMFGLNAIKDANILFNGHFHHLAVMEYSAEGRTTIQVPAQDTGSEWYRQSSGFSAAPGMLTLLIGEGLSNGRGYSDLQIL